MQRSEGDAPGDGGARLGAAGGGGRDPASVEGVDLVPSDLAAWRGLRHGLVRRQAIRTLGRRFRRYPEAYLKSLEDSFINQALPS